METAGVSRPLRWSKSDTFLPNGKFKNPITYKKKKVLLRTQWNTLWSIRFAYRIHFPHALMFAASARCFMSAHKTWVSITSFCNSLVLHYLFEFKYCSYIVAVSGMLVHVRTHCFVADFRHGHVECIRVVFEKTVIHIAHLDVNLFGHRWTRWFRSSCRKSFPIAHQLRQFELHLCAYILMQSYPFVRLCVCT